MVWIFQEGHLSGLLGFTATGTLNLAMPILMFSLAFGASMDYEVFLLSRIREEWLAGPKTTEGNTEAVAMGVARTGRIFTAAAVLMSIVFLGVGQLGCVDDETVRPRLRARGDQRRDGDPRPARPRAHADDGHLELVVAEAARGAAQQIRAP